MAGSEHDVDDTFLLKLYRELEEAGKIEGAHNETTGTKEVNLTESGQEQVTELLRESDEEVLRSLQAGVEDFDLQADRAQFVTRLTAISQHMRDDVGVNVFRVLERNPEAAAELGLEDISQELIEQFEPENGDSEP